MHNRLTVARDTVRAMIDASADLTFDNTVEHASASLARKTNAAEACIDTVRLALEVGGGAAFGRGAGIERFLPRRPRRPSTTPCRPPNRKRFTGRVALGLDPLG